MKTITKALAKGTMATVAAGAMAMGSASPAFARDRDGGISTGEVIAGALILGGIAAVIASSDDNNDRYGNYNYGDYRRGYGYGNPRNAVEQCVYAAERSASRYSYGGANVTDIRSVNDRRDGYTVRGRIEVNGWGRRSDRGNFTCKVRYGRVADLDFNGIRGLR
jgi:hypothetical protein